MICFCFHLHMMKMQIQTLRLVVVQVMHRCLREDVIIPELSQHIIDSELILKLIMKTSYFNFV